ncbi:MAG: phosphatidate cytidylyltransferase [Actinomycetota bacterium]
MSDDRRDDTGADETTGKLPATGGSSRDDTRETAGSSRDNTLDFGEEFGVVKFADSDDSSPAIRVDSTDTAQLPHWSEAPTGEAPRFGVSPRDPSRPVSRDPSRPVAAPPPVSRPAPEGRIRIGGDPTDPRARRPSDTHPTMRDRTGETRRAETGETRRAETGETRRPAAGDRSPRRPGAARPAQVRRQRPERSDSGTQPRPVGSDRNLGSAVIVGLVLVALFVGTSFVSPAAVMALVVVVLGLASLEFFTQTSGRGIPAPIVVGVVACISLPLGAYYMSHLAIAMIVVFAFIAAAVTLVGSNDDHSAAVTSIGAVMLGVVYVGVLGSYAAMILRLSTLTAALPNIGTDTLFIAVFGIAANDIGAYFVGSAIGRTPLRASISPNKTVEGLIGGTIASMSVVIIIGLQSETWNSLIEWILLGVVISFMAPLGDLFESLLKRSLGVKDFGTLLKGHGGVLDRFDGVLFSLPAVYFLAVTLAPWAS